MTTLEIMLLILGAVIFIASFLLPESRSQTEQMDKQLVQEQLQQALKEEIKNVHSQVEEAVSYSMERTERALERMTNEKISAVSEYTETVLSDIHKSHEEVMFLYDMLNEKHVNLKETANEVSKTVKEATEVVQEADTAKKEVSMATQVLDEVLTAATEAADKQEFMPIDISGIEKLKQQINKTEPSGGAGTDTVPAVEKKTTVKKKKTAVVHKDMGEEKVPDMSLHFDADQEAAENSNQRILELYKKGKSNVAIARELGLGVGEVKLVIDLFKGM